KSIQVAVSAEDAFGDASGIDENLGIMLGRDVHFLPHSGEASHGMLGAARDALGMAGAGRCAAVSVRGPRPPIWHRVEARAIAAGILLVLVIALLELTLYIRKDLAQAEHTRTAEAKKNFDTLVSAAQAKVDAVNKLKADIKAKEDEVKTMAARFDFFALELPARTE